MRQLRIKNRISLWRREMIISIEVTDLFCGEANYGWIKRETVTLSDNVSNLAIVRAAKRSVGLSGIRGRMANYGDSWEFRPYGNLVVVFISIAYLSETSMI